MKFSRILPIITVLLGLGLALAIFALNVYPFNQNSVSIVSPLPPFLSFINNKQVTTISLWEPLLEALTDNTKKTPDITACCVLMYDVTDDEPIFMKDPKKRVPIASLTKVMTAIIALENKRIDDRYYVQKHTLVGENSMGLSANEVLTLEELLYGLMLQSGNDAAEVMADNYSGGRSAFVAAMNEKAVSLGLTDTHFTNPTGLQGEGEQYSTAYDLLVITRYAISHFPSLVEISKTATYTIPAKSTHKQFYLQNEVNLITSYPGVKGFKDGYTPEAGFCLITYLDYSGHQVIGILLGSQNRREEMKGLLDYSLTVKGIKPPKHS